MHALDRGERTVDAVDVHQENCELVASETGRDIGVAPRDAEPERDLLENEITDVVSEAVLEAVRTRTPIGRLVTTDDIVDAAVFLLENPAVNGVNLEIDGGWTLK